MSTGHSQEFLRAAKRNVLKDFNAVSSVLDPRAPGAIYDTKKGPCGPLLRTEPAPRFHAFRRARPKPTRPASASASIAAGAGNGTGVMLGSPEFIFETECDPGSNDTNVNEEHCTNVGNRTDAIAADASSTKPRFGSV